jgi:hypothetical protein
VSYGRQAAKQTGPLFSVCLAVSRVGRLFDERPGPGTYFVPHGPGPGSTFVPLGPPGPGTDDPGSISFTTLDLIDPHSSRR